MWNTPCRGNTHALACAHSGRAVGHECAIAAKLQRRTYETWITLPSHSSLLTHSLLAQRRRDLVPSQETQQRPKNLLSLYCHPSPHNETSDSYTEFYSKGSYDYLPSIHDNTIFYPLNLDAYKRRRGQRNVIKMIDTKTRAFTNIFCPNGYRFS